MLIGEDLDQPRLQQALLDALASAPCRPEPMHLLRTTPGGFVDDAAGVMRIDQTPAPIVVLSSADTTLSLLASVVPNLEAGFPAVRLANSGVPAAAGIGGFLRR